MFPHARRDLDGPPFRLPPLLDALSERWWRARPRTRALVMVGFAVLMALAIAGRLSASPHGPPTPALVATRDLPAGHELTSTDLRQVRWPADLVPDRALTSPTGTLIAPLPDGAVATERHVGDAGIVAGVPDGQAVVPVPRGSLPELSVGARLELVAADAAGGAGHLVATDAVVVQVDEVAVWVAAPREEANALADAALRGPIGVVVVPP